VNGDVEVSPGVWLRYGCEVARLGPSLRARFLALSIDAPTRAFVNEALAHPAGPLRTRVYQAARAFVSDYDAYGLLGMYGMHLLSAGHVQALLADAPRGALLDVGAGDGAVTQVLAPMFERVSVTEASRVLRTKLARRGFTVIPQDLSVVPGGSASFDVIACLNVIDRCARPRSLLTHLRSMLTRDGRLLLSVPLPLRPHVHLGARTADPEESLPRSEDHWELDVTALVDELLSPLGYDVERVSRLPYVSRGDAHAPLYVLDAAVLVLRPRAVI
jgi:SAM-dependent methyltransferase